MLEAASQPVAAARRLRPADGASTYHHGDLRRALLDEAERQLEKHGAAGFSLRGLARAAHVSVAAPYHHFRDKQALLAALAVRGADALEEAAGRAVLPDMSNIAEAHCLAHLRFSRERPALYALMTDVARRELVEASASFTSECRWLDRPGTQATGLEDQLTHQALACLAFGVAELFGRPEMRALIDESGGDARLIQRLFHRIASLLERQNVQS